MTTVLTAKCPTCGNPEKVEVTRRNYKNKLSVTCTKCTREWHVTAPREVKATFEQSREQRKRSKKSKDRKPPSLPRNNSLHDTEEDLRRVPRRFKPQVLDRGEDDSYDESSENSMEILSMSPLMKASQGTGRSMRSPSAPVTSHSSKEKRKRDKKRRKREKSGPKKQPSSVNLVKVTSPRFEEDSYGVPVDHDPEQPRSNFAKCLVKSVECDGNLVVLMGQCTFCGTGNEVDVPAMDAKTVMEVECYKCNTTYFMVPPSQNLLQAFGADPLT